MTHYAEALAGELSHVTSSELADRRELAIARLVGEFERQAPLLNDEAIELYDVALRWLVADMERTALAALSERLADIPNAPAGVIRILAFDDDLAIAGPVLARSPRLAPGDLIAIIGEKGEEHILLIARRSDLNTDVTDSLIARGAANVLHTLAANGRAPLSDNGRGILVARAAADRQLAVALADRFGLPEALRDRLIDDAVTILETHLAVVRTPGAAIDEAVTRGLSTAASAAVYGWIPNSEENEPASDAAQDRTQTRDARFLQLCRDGRLDLAADLLAEPIGLPADAVRSVLGGEDDFLILMALRAAGLSWPAVEKALQAREPARTLPFDPLRRKFHAISPEDAARRLAIVCRARGRIAAAPVAGAVSGKGDAAA